MDHNILLRIIITRYLIKYKFHATVLFAISSCLFECSAITDIYYSSINLFIYSCKRNNSFFIELPQL